MEEACKDSNIFPHMVNGKPTVKENDKSGYYDQVQRQLAVTELPWCNFVFHPLGSHNVNVECISFRQRYHDEILFPKVKKFTLIMLWHFWQENKWLKYLKVFLWQLNGSM